MSTAFFLERRWRLINFRLDNDHQILASSSIPAVGDFYSTAFYFSEGDPASAGVPCWAASLAPDAITAVFCGKEKGNGF